MIGLVPEETNNLCFIIMRPLWVCLEGDVWKWASVLKLKRVFFNLPYSSASPVSSEVVSVPKPNLCFSLIFYFTLFIYIKIKTSPVCRSSYKTLERLSGCNRLQSSIFIPEVE